MKMFYEDVLSYFSNFFSKQMKLPVRITDGDVYPSRGQLQMSNGYCYENIDHFTIIEALTSRLLQSSTLVCELTASLGPFD
jgi:hypothetical protein